MKFQRMRMVCAVVCLVIMTAPAITGQEQGQTPPQEQTSTPEQRPRRRATPVSVQKIYVGDMGYDDEAERFRLLIEEQLQKRDFDIAANPDEADAVLTGILTVTHYEYNYDASVAVRLTSRAGDVLLTKGFGASAKLFANPLNRKEPLQQRAEQVAEALKREYKKPAKKTP